MPLWGIPTQWKCHIRPTKAKQFNTRLSRCFCFLSVEKLRRGSQSRLMLPWGREGVPKHWSNTCTWQMCDWKSTKNNYLATIMYKLCLQGRNSTTKRLYLQSGVTAAVSHFVLAFVLTEEYWPLDKLIVVKNEGLATYISSNSDACKCTLKLSTL